jgi:hypothetical protein
MGLTVQNVIGTMNLVHHPQFLIRYIPAQSGHRCPPSLLPLTDMIN